MLIISEECNENIDEMERYDISCAVMRWSNSEV